MADQQGGKLVYEVDLELGRLIEGQRELTSRLNNSGKSADGLSKSLGSLSKVASGLAAAISVQQIAEYGNAWVTVNNKLVNSVRASEDLITVTQRVFDISQDTRSSLEATATLYGRLERATRSAGTSTADLSKLVETINKGLTVSGATTEEASSTMIQLSQALASGVLRGEEFNSISENGSRLAVALADSLGVTIGQLRAMAAQGQLTTEVVVNGLLKQSDKIAKEFTNTTMTMSQAFTVATNNITKFVGEASSVNTTLNVFNQGVITLSENLDTVASLIGAAALIFGGRFVGALTLATQSRIADTLAAAAQANATAKSTAAAATAAAVTARKSMLDKEAALSSLALAQAEYNVAKGSSAEAFALENLNTVKSIAIQRSAAFAEAQTAQAAATRTATTAAAAATTTVGGLARGALSIIGGPAGAAVIAGAAIFYFYQKVQQAKQESLDFADKLDGVIAKMKEMSQVQLAAEIDKANKSITVQNDQLSNNEASLEDLTTRLKSARQAVQELGKDNILYASALENLNTLESESVQLTAKVEAERNKLSQTISKTGILHAQMNGTFAQGIDLLKRDGHEAGVAAGLFNQLGSALDLAGKAKDKFNSKSLVVPRSANGDKVLDNIRDENELLAITDKRTRAIAEARQNAFNAGVADNSPQLKQIESAAAANYDLKQAEAERNKQAKESNKTVDEGAKKIADLQRQLGYLSLKYDDSSREAAVYNAMQAAGEKATEAQKQKIGELAGALFDAKQKQSDLNEAIAADPIRNADKSYDDATKQLKRQLDEGIVNQQQFNKESEKLAQDHASAISQANANAVVSPQQAAAGTVDPVQQLANENAKKLALIQQFEANKTITEQQGLQLRRAANKQYEQERTDAMFQLWSQQTIGNEVAANALNAFGQSASSALSGVITGTQSASDAMLGLANTVLSSVIQTFVDMGIQQAKSAIMGATVQQSAIAATTSAQVAGIATQTTASTAAAATTTAAWTPAALVASVASFGGAAAIGAAALIGVMALSGKRKNGGPVSAGGMYQVGEGGMPEIYQSSSGRQYMIPGDNGSVISNKELQGGGGSSGGVIVNINNYTPATVDMQQTPNANGGITVDLFIADMNAGGPMSQSITSNTTASRRAQNQ